MMKARHSCLVDPKSNTQLEESKVNLHRAMVVCAVFVAVGAALAQASVPAVVNYQCRLTTGSGTPVTGPTPMVFRIFDAEAGGTALWSETQPSVVVEDGLFNVLLGSATPLNPDLFASPPLGGTPPFGGRYLEVEVNGEVIAPRTRLISVAYAVGAERMFGDVHTTPGEVLILGSGGDELASMKGKDSASTVTVTHPQTPGHKSIDLRSAASGADVVAVTDLDGDGAPELVSRLMSTDISAGVYLDADSDDDGLSDNEADLAADASGARMAIKSKGTGAKRLAMGGDCDDTEANFYASQDFDGDGLAERLVQIGVGDSSSGVSADQQGVVVSMGTRKGWDGTIKGSCSLTSGTDRSVTATVDDSAGVVAAIEGTVEVSMGTRKGWDGTIKGSCSLASGTDRSVSATVDDSAGVVSATEGAVEVSMGTRKGWDGTIKGNCTLTSGTDRSVSSTVDDSAGVVAAVQDSVLVSMSARKGWDGTIKGSCSLTSGADRAVSSTVDDSASVVAATQGSLEVSMGTRKGWDGTIKGSCIVMSGTDRMAEMNSDGIGYLDNSLGVGVDATHRIDVAGGAYCDGTDWVNASDVNAKENFAPVDGADLLRKIAALEITQWNYKGDPSEEHIGPTAQDFRETFGVGSDGKSISTIDPSGIALAAIKELNRQNQRLAGENAELKKQIDALARRLETIAAER